MNIFDEIHKESMDLLPDFLMPDSIMKKQLNRNGRLTKQSDSARGSWKIKKWKNSIEFCWIWNIEKN